MTYEPHPLCDLLPEMSAREFDALRADIRAHGLRRPLVLFESKILDGRHRYRACTELGVEPRVEQFSGCDPAAFVISENLRRRNLTESQLAMCATRFLDYERARAKERMVAGQPWHHVVPGSEAGRAAAKVSARFGVGKSTVERAIRVKRDGVPELVDRVEAGDMTVTEAARIASLGNKETQRRLAAIPDKKARDKKANAIIQMSVSKRTPRQIAPAPAGTEFVRAVIGRIELVTNEIASRGLADPGLALQRFSSEFGWDDPIQVARLGHCMPALQMLSELYRVACNRKVAA